MRTKLLLLLTAFAIAHSASPPQKIQLLANINPDSLLIKLQNNGTIPLTVVTGIIADRAYPAANFQFTVRLSDQRRYKLECWKCGPQVIGGSIGLYERVLRPGGGFEVTVPLADITYQERTETRSLCGTETASAILTVSLKGEQHNQKPSEAWAPYWTGSASASVSVTCRSNE